jgi:hypothetical protein
MTDSAPLLDTMRYQGVCPRNSYLGTCKQVIKNMKCPYSSRSRSFRDQGASRDEDTKAKISMVDLQSSTLALIQDVKNRLVDTKLHFL